KLNNILNFNILLKNSKAKKLSMVPPAYYFSSTYIEQMHGWNEIWNSFNNLGQFDKRNRFELSKYLCGILNKDYYENKEEQNSYTLKNIDINKTISERNLVIDYFKQSESLDSKNQIQDKIFETSRSVIDTENKIINKKNDYIQISSRIAAIENEINIVQLALGEIELDYEFSIENIETTSILCPTCGVEHKNNLVNRFSLINDENKLLKKLENLNLEKKGLLASSYKISNQITYLYENIENAYSKNSFKEYFNNYFVNNSLLPELNEKVFKDNSKIKSNTEEIRKIGRKNKKIETINLKNTEEEIVSYFNSLCSELDIKMYLKDNLYDILNYNSGGANQIKAMLAKRLTILNAINMYGEPSTPPFIIDSPRQQDIDPPNYHKMLAILIKSTPENVQLIIAAVQNTFIDEIKSNFEEIHLEDTLLKHDEYDQANFLITHS
ncbi:hypothetical protein AAV96_05015, partial [Acinetobacter sp. AG1]